MRLLRNAGRFFLDDLPSPRAVREAAAAVFRTKYHWLTFDQRTATKRTMVFT